MALGSQQKPDSHPYFRAVCSAPCTKHSPGQLGSLPVSPNATPLPQSAFFLRFSDWLQTSPVEGAVLPEVTAVPGMAGTSAEPAWGWGSGGFGIRATPFGEIPSPSIFLLSRPAGAGWVLQPWVQWCFCSPWSNTNTSKCLQRFC